ncbi:MAG: PmoA family protein [Bryobacteraceae bacterium]
MSFRGVLVLAAVLPLLGEVKVSQGEGRVDVEIDGKPFTTLYTDGPTKPYLHPLRAASGVIVTRHFPMENVAGETHDHPHHRGLWFTHGNVNGFDFWDEGAKDKQGKVRLKGVTNLKSGNKEGLVSAVFEWVDPTGKVLLTEDRTMKFRGGENVRIIDFDASLRAETQVRFGDTKEGTFAIRLAESLKEDKGGTGRMVNAEGAETEAHVWGKASPWVDYSGVVEGQKVGIAIFDHPANPKHPTFWHSRAYGLFAANPFGEHDFFNDKTRDGGLTMEAGQIKRFRYRVVIHTGNAATADIASLYERYSKD